MGRKLARLMSAAALAVALPFSVCWGQMPDQANVHRMAARQYELPGLVEEAVSEWIKVLALSPEDGEARARVEALVRKQMPRSLPEEAERAAPFRCEVLEWRWQGQGLPALQGSRFLVTAVEFAAREGERWDELHERGFSQVDYGYVWWESKRRYEVRVVAHWEEPSQAELAHKALRATLVFYTLARGQLGFDPTRPWGDPVDIWVTNKGEPGARAQGRSIYLYAAKTERAPGEWLREIAHEYGHVSFPGIGGFTETSDPWADGELAELLFAKWLGGTAKPRSHEDTMTSGTLRQQATRSASSGQAEAAGGFGAEASEATEDTEAARALRQQATRSANSGRAEATTGVGAPEWMPWSVAEWEAEEERERLMGMWAEEEVARVGQERGPAERERRLAGADEKAKEAFLGLALRVDEMKGPQFLGEVLKKCGRGEAEGFVRALGRKR